MNFLRDIPIIKQTLFFLEEAGSTSGIKITETGSLGRNFVQTLWDLHIKKSEDEDKFRPTRELECPEATKLRFLLCESKYVRKYKGKIVLTQKGRLVLKNEYISELYYNLITTAMFRWNWGYEDRYPDYEFIQKSAEYLIHQLAAWPSNTISAKQLFDDVFRPSVSQSIDMETKEQIQRCLMIRFLYRFCIPFGILVADEADHFLDKRISDQFEKTDFFTTHFMKLIADYSAANFTEETSPKISDSLTFSKKAKTIWDQLNPKDRLRIMNNVYCVSCKDETGIGNVTGTVENKCLVLRGICTRCGDPVVRLIEHN